MRQWPSRSAFHRSKRTSFRLLRENLLLRFAEAGGEARGRARGGLGAAAEGLSNELLPRVAQ